MYRSLVEAVGNESEADYASIFDEPSFATIGAAYEKRPRFSAGAYSSIIKRLEHFMDAPLKKAIQVRDARADKLLVFDDAVGKVVEALKAKGLVSPYLKNYVVARVNFLRFAKGDDFDFDETIDKLTKSVQKIDAAKVNKEDVAKAGGGGPPESDD
jgi:ParB family chromosome partitioning protein